MSTVCAKGIARQNAELGARVELTRTAAPPRDISHLVAAAIECVLGGRYEGSGWRRFVWDDIE